MSAIIIVVVSIILVVVLLVALILLLHGRRGMKGTIVVGDSTNDWQRQAQQGDAGAWNQQGGQASGGWGQPAQQQPGGWGTPDAGSWRAPTQQPPGGWGAQAPSQPANPWGAPANQSTPAQAQQQAAAQYPVSGSVAAQYPGYGGNDITGAVAAFSGQKDRGLAARDLAHEYLQFTAFYSRVIPTMTWNTLLVYAHIEAALQAVREDALKFKEEIGSLASEASAWAALPT